MMKFISVPIKFIQSDIGLECERPIENFGKIIDNLVEMIALTPKGTFTADPDFGFEFWDPLYGDIDNYMLNTNPDKIEIRRHRSKELCEREFIECIINYAPPSIKFYEISAEISCKNDKIQLRDSGKFFSYREVTIAISAKIDGGMGTQQDYYHEVSFMMEPISRRTSR